MELSSDTRLKKAPEAPRRFKSAYIWFSSEKHREFKERLGENAKTTDVAKELAEEWKNMKPEEREKWEEMSRKDRQRYQREKEAYGGPWRVNAPRRTKKDPTAPKRPPSAFFDFSNSKRAAIKRQNPDADNGTISRILAQMWREAPEEVRLKHIEKEQRLRDDYKIAIAEWREKDEKKKEVERKEREESMMKNFGVTSKEGLADYAHSQAAMAATSVGVHPGQGLGYMSQGAGGLDPVRMQQQMLIARQLEEQRAAMQLHDSFLMQQILARQQQRDLDLYAGMPMSSAGILGSPLGYGRSIYDDPSMLYSGGHSTAQQMRDAASFAGVRNQLIQRADGPPGESAGPFDDGADDEKAREVSDESKAGV